MAACGHRKSRPARAAFWRAVETGQFDDLDTPAVRVVADDDRVPR